MAYTTVRPNDGQQGSCARDSATPSASPTALAVIAAALPAARRQPLHDG